MPFPFYHTVASTLSLVANKKLFWWGMFAVLLFPFAILVLYNHPSADDYCYVVDAAVRGFWQSQWATYQNWSGRYVSTFLLISNPIAMGSFVGYQMISFLLLLLTVISCLFFVKVLLHKKEFDLSVLAVSFCMVLLYLLKMPSLTEGFYWLAGAITYQVANIAALTSVTLLLSMRSEQKSTWKIIACLFLTVVICGGNETSMLEFLYLLVALILFEYASTRRIPKYYYLLLIVALVATCITIVAPGNAVRSAYYHGETNLFKAFLLAARSGVARLQDWYFDLSILLILFLPFLRQVELNDGDSRKITPTILLLYPFFIFGILIVGFFPAFWSLGSEPPTRTLNVLYFIFLASSFHYTVLWIIYIRQQKGIFIIVPVFAQCILLFFLFRNVAPQNHYRTAAMDLISGRANTYDKEMKERYVEIQKQHHADVVWQPLTAIPTSIFFVDIEAKPDDWKNLCTSDYFHLKSLKLTEAKE